MTIRSLSHPGGRSTFNLLQSAAGAWLGIVAAAFLLEVLWRGMRGAGESIPSADWSDGIIVSGLVLACTWFYLHKQEWRSGPVRLAAVGALWVSLSITLEYAYRLYAVDHYMMRFLVDMFMGDYHGVHGWLWDLFLAVQLCAPLMVGGLRDAVSHRAIQRWQSGL